MNPLFFHVLVVILLFLAVLGCGWVHVLSLRVQRVAEIVDTQRKELASTWLLVKEMETDLPKVKLMELQELFGTLKSEFDGVLVENDAFRQKCTNQMQRFDSIMRRNKAVLAKGGKVQQVVLDGDGDLEDDGDDPLPQRFLAENPAALKPNQQMGATVTAGAARDERRVAMRKKWKENRGL